MRKLIIYLALVLNGMQSSIHAQDNDVPAEIKIEITRVTDDLYRFQYHMHASAFLVTDEGIIVTDPVTEEAALWLKKELKTRFDKPVRYMIYSHHHSDHIGGANVFADDSVTIVSHKLAREALMKLYDKAKLPIPDTTFEDEMTISLGGKTVRLFHVKPGTHGNSLIVVLFVEDRTLFCVDLLSIGGTNFMMGWRENIFPGNLETIKNLEKLDLDFEYLISGHYPLATREVVSRSREYLEDIRDAVMAAIQEGKSLQETVNTVRLEKYKDLRRYDLIDLNVASVYDALTNKPLVGDVHKEESEYMGLTKYIGNPQRAKVACAPCHGMKGVSRYGIFPNLAGQKYEYLQKSLRNYDSRDRFDPVMSSMDYMSDQDLDDLALYFSSLDLPLPRENLDEQNDQVNNARQIAGKSCVACHGADGVSPAGLFPNLSGQNYKYLLKALKSYKSGRRDDAVMLAALDGLNDQDLQDLALYYSRLPAVKNNKE